MIYCVNLCMMSLTCKFDKKKRKQQELFYSMVVKGEEFNGVKKAKLIDRKYDLKIGFF